MSDIYSRKERSISNNLKIVKFNPINQDPIHFTLQVLGTTGKTYFLNFKQNFTYCTCPDFERRKKICKHIFFILGKIANDKELFKSINRLENFDNDNLTVIFQKLQNEIINRANKKKKEHEKIEIERDEECSICGDEFHDLNLWKCAECRHVFHKPCLTQWWNTDPKIRGMCAYCRTVCFNKNQLGENNDPWAIFEEN